MFEGLTEFAINNKWPLLFYAGIILLILTFKHKFEWHGIAGLYKTTFGVPLMKRMSERYRELFKWLGYVGVGVGFVGMASILWMLIYGLWSLVFRPDAPAVIAPVIPGFNIPGVGIEVPLITGWIALFIVIVVHEFSHGVVSKAHKIPVKSSGLLVFGPIFGAFVEPEEKKLSKASDVVQYSVFAAGPFSNVLAAAVVILLLMPLIGLLVGVSTEPVGVAYALTPGLPAEAAGMPETGVITAVGAQQVETADELLATLEGTSPGDEVLLTASGEEYALEATADESSDRGLVGISNLQSERAPIKDVLWFTILVGALLWLQELARWLFILNLGIGLANLLPLGPVDGGRMVQTLFTKLWGKDRGEHRWKQLSKVTLVVILILLFVPIIKAVAF